MILSCFFAWPVYLFYSPQPFSGDAFYNPYTDTAGEWLKANFHAHTGAYMGITPGKGDPDEILKVYGDMGYDLIGLSNYMVVHHPAKPDARHVKVYEKGFNLKKHHFLVINAQDVVYRDYLLPHSIHQKQFILNALQHDSSIVCIPHPKIRTGFDPADFTLLQGNQLMEIASTYTHSPEHWMKALDSGVPLWVLGNDDTHNIRDTAITGRYYTQIRSTSHHAYAAVQALRKGNHYAVESRRGREYIHLKHQRIKQDTLLVAFQEKMDSLVFFTSANKRLLKVANASKAACYIGDVASWCRVEAHKGYSRVWLNPVVRTRDASFPTRVPPPAMDLISTSLLWGYGFFLVFSLSLLIFPALRGGPK